MVYSPLGVSKTDCKRLIISHVLQETSISTENRWASVVLWIIEKIVMPANLDVFFMEMNLKACKNDKLQKLCPHFCHVHLQK